MTEDEAKGKWCPFARLSGVSDEGGAVFPAGNRAAILRGNEAASFNDNPESCRCLASACMAWRWNQAAETHIGGTEKTLRPGEHTVEKMREIGWIEVARHPNGHGPDGEYRDTIEWFKPPQGLCGLAGAQQ